MLLLPCRPMFPKLIDKFLSIRGCQVIPGGEVFIDTVGTFGVASASYYWSRVAWAVGRLAQYLVGHHYYVAHAGCR